jgi:hypothetical protein
MVVPLSVLPPLFISYHLKLLVCRAHLLLPQRQSRQLEMALYLCVNSDITVYSNEEVTHCHYPDYRSSPDGLKSSTVCR